MVHKFRNLKGIKCLFQMCRIGVHITGDHRHIPVAVTLFSYKTPDLGRHKFCFLPGIAHCMDENCICRSILPVVCSALVGSSMILRIPEELFFQQPQRRIFLKTPHRFFI